MNVQENLQARAARDGVKLTPEQDQLGSQVDTMANGVLNLIAFANENFGPAKAVGIARRLAFAIDELCKANVQEILNGLAADGDMSGIFDAIHELSVADEEAERIKNS